MHQLRQWRSPLLTWALAITVTCGVAIANESKIRPETNTTKGVWQTDYGATLATAEAEQKLALLWFVKAAWAQKDESFARTVLQHPDIEARLSSKYVFCKLAIDTPLTAHLKSPKLIDHQAFADMGGRSGFVILDMTDRSSSLHRRVVSVLPIRDRYPTREQVGVLLNLPRGTLTQRTLIYAVRTHPERPASASGECSPLLSQETASHSAYQARLALQGHHQWESRFHAINAKLPGGLVAQEVCAESWPHQSLLDAAMECVDSWRQSPGHWEAVRTQPALFGYDMQRGGNGIWYATGIFARRQ